MLTLDDKAVVGEALDRLFLLFYGTNLCRTYRADPADACDDAEIQISILILLAIGACVIVLGALFAPIRLSALLDGGRKSIGGLVVVTGLVVYLVHRRYGRYELTPELSRTYQTPQHRRTAAYIYWGGAVGWIVIVAMVLS